MFELITSPFLDDYLLLRPGSESGIRLPVRSWEQLASTASGQLCPGWLVDAARRRWPDRERLLQLLADAGVLWLQLTGGEPLIDKLFTAVSPTIYGGTESLPAQSQEYLRKRKPFTGCNAGHTFFHVDPHGMASICKVGRDPQVPLLEEGLTGLGGIADRLLLRQGGCTGCQLHGSCGTCMPLVTLYRKAKAPLSTYCQH
ncbi:hypothetical protein DMA12_43045 [Amycolatopsis balhimycina DSM 5908]|uniref:Radical SAM protein n=1 Tax=Amycolatopsis balhimycina DSM 5908 TaxID=1081091 RepID=A0A428VXX5_AMYBA|nr:hypothetical protein [Amycolatopsis balhimycina]RSM35704.1 hypothetical protein DMA12_43045 [Amycolatopsis balhimycina DSM 5908]